ncbi:CocE/NonD family hydrolase, partial [Streptomyces sp. NPDC059697]|uniref:CocE/NonD family hydrolase n=1 Tax=Streptomyces sp. NPDC059697 TaxID=3346912 RepID=UPI0036A349E4
GATGMIGKSWDGSITNGVAATGVKGLRTIVPVSSISSWYDAYFSQGAWPAGSAPTPGALIRMVESDAAGNRCATPLTPVAEGGALVFYVQTEAGTPRATVRRLDRVDGWCERAGGTQELMRIVRPAEDGHVARSSYACLNNAFPTVIQQTTEILATAAISR